MTTKSVKPKRKSSKAAVKKPYVKKIISIVETPIAEEPIVPKSVRIMRIEEGKNK